MIATTEDTDRVFKRVVNGNQKKKNKQGKRKQKQQNKPKFRPDWKPTSSSTVRAMIQEEIANDKSHVNVTKIGAEYASCVTDPFGTYEVGGLPLICRIPDNDSNKTVLLRMTGSYNFAGSTATSGFIQMHGLTINGGTPDKTLVITYGADAMAPGVSMSARAESDDLEKTIAGAILNGATLRIVSAGLRVNPITDSTNSAGTLEPGQSTVNLTTTSSAYSTNAVIIQGINANAQFPIMKGITVRRTFDDKAFSFVTPSSTAYTTPIPYGPMPLVRFSGLSSTTTLRIDWCYVIEAMIVTAAPIPQSFAVYEPEFDQLLALIASYPHYAEGHSFKSFITSVWNTAKKVGGFLWKNKSTLLPAAAGVAKLF